MTHRTAAVAGTLALVVSLGVSPPASAEHDEDQHSDNMSLVANWDHDGTYRQGSDMAFWGNVAVLGNFGEPGGFRLLDISRPARPRLIGQLECHGHQNDVSIWEDIVILSVDTPMADDDCHSELATQAQTTSGTAWEGIRVVSIRNPARPRQLAAVYTDCGSHTHTILPDLHHRDWVTGRAAPRLIVYVLSYPVSGQGARCNAGTHRKISVVEVPLNRPQAARVISAPSVSPAIGCHDVTILMSLRIAAAACLTESQIWDVSDPADPKVLSRIYNPAINIHHGTTFSWDGKTVVIGDELGGAAAAPGCLTPGNTPTGALWFYDVSDNLRPELRGWFRVPQTAPSILCTAHQMNTIPLRNGKDILSIGWYNAGTSVVDFTDPSAPEQIGYYIPSEPRPNSWASYWYNGLIYANNFDEDLNASDRSRGVDVLRIRHPDLRDHIVLPYLNPQTMDPLPSR